MVIAPHRAFAVGHALAERGVIPAVRTMIDGTEQQTLMFRVRAQIPLAGNCPRHRQSRLAMTCTTSSVTLGRQIISEPDQALCRDVLAKVSDSFKCWNAGQSESGSHNIRDVEKTLTASTTARQGSCPHPRFRNDYLNALMIALLSRHPPPDASTCFNNLRCSTENGSFAFALLPSDNISRTSFRCWESLACGMKSPYH